MTVDVAGGRYETVAEVVCYGIPARYAKKYPYMGNDFWMLHRVWVCPRHRRKGIARGLLRDMIHLAEARGVSLVLRINPFEQKAIRRHLRPFYRSLGFKAIPGSKDLMQRI